MLNQTPNLTSKAGGNFYSVAILLLASNTTQISKVGFSSVSNNAEKEREPDS